MTAKKEENKNHKVITLKDLGPVLPITRFIADKPVEKLDFSFLEWDMTVEEKLAEIKAKAKSMGQFINQMMSLLLDRFCGQDFQAMTKEERLISLNQLEYPNMMYMYVYLRVEELGDELRLDVNCPHCGKLNKDFVCSLHDMEVHAKGVEHARKIDFTLKKPILMANEQIITGLKIDIAKWDAMENADAELSENDAKVKQLLFNSSICGASVGDGEPMKGFVDVQTIVKKLKKIDIERLGQAIAQNNGGPMMAVKGKCQHCAKEWAKLLNWGYDYFFDNSSL